LGCEAELGVVAVDIVGVEVVYEKEERPVPVIGEQLDRPVGHVLGGDDHPIEGLGLVVHREPLRQADLSCQEVPRDYSHGHIAVVSQDFGEGELLRLKAPVDVLGPVLLGVQAGEHGGERRQRPGRLGVGVAEFHGPRRQEPPQVRREVADVLVRRVQADRVPPQRVDGDYEDVLAPGSAGLGVGPDDPSRGPEDRDAAGPADHARPWEHPGPPPGPEPCSPHRASPFRPTARPAPPRDGTPNPSIGSLATPVW